MSEINSLPDEAVSGRPLSDATLCKVGMEGISIPLFIASGSGEAIPVTAAADVFVELDDPQAKGIHMSRLYKLLVDKLANRSLNQHIISDLMEALIASQQGLSNSAELNLRFSLMLPKKALVSEEMGYQRYQLSLAFASRGGSTTSQTAFVIPYSSTCPCSARLSRTALRDAVVEKFGSGTVDTDEIGQWLAEESGSIATPHSQRSYATVMLESKEATVLPLLDIITSLEVGLGTPVQTAVKREDEQAFARLNAENLMFCEDAARKLKNIICALPRVEYYWLKVDHRESLHAHNAVAIDFSGEHLAQYRPVYMDEYYF